MLSQSIKWSIKIVRVYTPTFSPSVPGRPSFPGAPRNPWGPGGPSGPLGPSLPWKHQTAYNMWVRILPFKDKCGNWVSFSNQISKMQLISYIYITQVYTDRHATVDWIINTLIHFMTLSPRHYTSLQSLLQVTAASYIGLIWAYILLITLIRLQQSENKILLPALPLVQSLRIYPVSETTLQ